ncbi:MAG: hypothetical protein ACYDET_07460 [Thermoleophilia bacterium]
MQKKLRIIGVAILAGAAIVVAAAGCGGNDQPQQAQNLLNAATSGANGASNALSQELDALKKTPMTVEIVRDGKSDGKWTQGSDGSWRLQSDTTEIIYNASQHKTWSINGNTATESTTPEASYEAFNPATMLAAFAYFPQTGGSGNTREYGAGNSKVTVEFNGPNGLPSKFTEVDSQGKTSVTDFNYSDVGNVPSSDFELPSGVSVTTVPGAGSGSGSGMPSGSTLPGGGSIPGMPQQ